MKREPGLETCFAPERVDSSPRKARFQRRGAPTLFRGEFSSLQTADILTMVAKGCRRPSRRQNQQATHGREAENASKEATHAKWASPGPPRTQYPR
jgi:hypothetical protein